MRLTDRVAIVTGAASGIGQAIAQALAAEGARVAVLDLNEGGARATVAAIRDAGGEALPVGADVTRRTEIEAAVGEVVDRYGALHILVNTARCRSSRPTRRSGTGSWP
jgi:3-oxoacyl-[acyl-carrier protein] reductase